MLIDKINPKNKKVIAALERDIIHKTGAWHLAIHGNIIRFNKNQLQILVQRRTGYVDIAKNAYDQSIAIQVLSGETDLDQTLLRGLYEELGLKSEDVEFVRFNRNGSLKIKKTYKYDKSLKNNEIVHLYLIKTNKNPKPHSKKVESIEWMDWENFVTLTHGEKCTKSSRMYTWNQKIKSEVEKAMFQFLETGKIEDVVINMEFRSLLRSNKFYENI